MWLIFLKTKHFLQPPGIILTEGQECILILRTLSPLTENFFCSPQCGISRNSSWYTWLNSCHGSLLTAEAFKQWGQWECLCSVRGRLGFWALSALHPGGLESPKSLTQPHREVSKGPNNPCAIASTINRFKMAFVAEDFNWRNVNNIKSPKLSVTELATNPLWCAVFRSLSPCSQRNFCFAYAVTNTRSCSHQVQNSTNTLMWSLGSETDLRTTKHL